MCTKNVDLTSVTLKKIYLTLRYQNTRQIFLFSVQHQEKRRDCRASTGRAKSAYAQEENAGRACS